MSFDTQLKRLFDDVGSSTGIEVLETKRGKARPDLPDAATVFEWAARRSMPLDPALQRCFAPIGRSALHWKLRDGKPNDGGEFSLYNIYDALVAPAPRLWNDATPAEEKAFLDQLHPFDEQRHAGEGKFAALRVEPNSQSPSVWFFQLTAPSLALDVDYCGYLDALLVTKGYYGWQYLFADVDLRSRELSFYSTQMKKMLDALPKLFPDHDYEPLRKRLADRTQGKTGGGKK